MSVTDPLAAAITDAVVGAGMRVGRNRLQAVVEQAGCPRKLIEDVAAEIRGLEEAWSS